MCQCTSTRPGSTYPDTGTAATPGSVKVSRPWCTQTSGCSATSPPPAEPPLPAADPVSTRPVRCQVGASVTASAAAEELLEPGGQLDRGRVHLVAPLADAERGTTRGRPSPGRTFG